MRENANENFTFARAVLRARRSAEQPAKTPCREVSARRAFGPTSVNAGMVEPGTVLRKDTDIWCPELAFGLYAVS